MKSVRTRPVAVKRRVLLVLLCFCLLSLFCISFPNFIPPFPFPFPFPPHRRGLTPHQSALLKRCKETQTPAGPPPTYSRVQSDRYVPGTPPILLRNAKILTEERNGTEIVFGDVLLDKGLVQAVGFIPPELLPREEAYEVVDVEGKWVTPGLVDLHSHLGVDSAPALSGASDTNSHQAPILPWLRSIDGLNTHDDAYKLAIAGGVTTVQVLPGSANNIGGQAVVIKLRPTADRSVSSKVVEPPKGLFVNLTTDDNEPEFVRWRHMKHACGENPDRVYDMSRMDAAWEFRQAYNEAKMIKRSQDDFCARDPTSWTEEEDFPEGELRWESLVDVLRGKVKLSIHCYEAVDLDMIVRLSNEFEFPVASFHHAGETYLVPDLLKKTYGGPPSIALFASNARKKREAYRGSEFASRILAEHGIPVVMKSDHPVLNGRYLMYEAQKAHFYGLHPALAISSVTATSADALGLGHRLGRLKTGFDADLVIWDSHPLALGATPVQVYVDGIPQLDPSVVVAKKPEPFQVPPRTPNFDKEAKEAVEYEGLPPLDGKRKVTGTIRFVNVRSMWVRDSDTRVGVKDVFIPEEGNFTVTVRDGRFVDACLHSCDSLADDEATVVDLKGGSLAPGLTTYGSPIGLVEIRMEASTNDGVVFEPFRSEVPGFLNATLVRAVDGLLFGGRNTLLAYREGVTTAITAPSGEFLSGIGVAFSVGASNVLEKGAVVQKQTALHIALRHGSLSGISVSTQIGAMRAALLGGAKDKRQEETVWTSVRKGEVPLVIDVDSADIMATLIALKAEYEKLKGEKLFMTFTGAAEAHLLAEEIAQAGINVVLVPVRPFPNTWDQRRYLPGPPLSNDTAVVTLLRKGVNVGIGVVDEHDARNTRFDVAWTALESGGRIGKDQALALATTSLETALGLSSFNIGEELVVYEGGDMFELESKVVGIVSSRERCVILLH